MSRLVVEVPALPIGWSQVRGPGIHLVLGRPSDDPLVGQLQAALSADRGQGGDQLNDLLDDLLDLLLRAGVRGLPDFVAVDEVDPVRLVVRGAPVAEVTVDGEVRPIAAGGVRTWADVHVSGNIELVTLRLAPVEQAPEPALIVAADALPSPAPALQALPSWSDDAPMPPLPSYDALFGSTQRAVAFHAEDRPVTPSPTAEALPRSLHPSPTVSAVVSSPAVASDLSLPAPAASFPPASEPASTLAARSRPAGPTVMTVLAVLCPVGHPSPPDADNCRLCNREILGQQPSKAARPVLGSLRLSTGDTVSLDRGVLFGRAPTVTGDPSGPERPKTLRLASPDNDISRNHAGVLLDGWQVIVRDLGSTNGTTVALPGERPKRLSANDAQVITPGTVVALADEVSFTFEVEP